MISAVNQSIRFLPFNAGQFWLPFQFTHPAYTINISPHRSSAHTQAIDSLTLSKPRNLID